MRFTPNTTAIDLEKYHVLTISNITKNKYGDTHNIFELWLMNNKRLPFVVRNYHWSEYSKFEVTEIELSDRNIEYFKEKSKLYGNAYGYFYKNNVKQPFQMLSSPGCYNWILIGV
jgi:hypothetical protein